ncbi:MAG: hypothetical protein FJ291_05900 [Planctomycetes bacterium]|nr:hypothetical protein [Planctomycetota bacterium]
MPHPERPPAAGPLRQASGRPPRFQRAGRGGSTRGRLRGRQGWLAALPPVCHQALEGYLRLPGAG